MQRGRRDGRMRPTPSFHLHTSSAAAHPKAVAPTVLAPTLSAALAAESGTHAPAGRNRHRHKRQAPRYLVVGRGNGGQQQQQPVVGSSKVTPDAAARRCPMFSVVQKILLECQMSPELLLEMVARRVSRQRAARGGVAEGWRLLVARKCSAEQVPDLLAIILVASRISGSLSQRGLDRSWPRCGSPLQ